MDADGTHARVRVPELPINGLHAVVWSPDSTRVAYLGPTVIPSPSGAPVSVVFIRVSDGHRTESGTSVVAHSASGLAWSPDGTRLAFSFWADPTGAAIHIAVIAADESSDASVDLASGDIPDMRLGVPIWAPDSASIAVGRELLSFDGSTIIGGGVLVFDATRSGVVSDLGVTDADGPGTPTWSADSAWIGYLSEVHDTAGTHPGPIVEAAVDGTTRRDVNGTDTSDAATWIEWAAWQPMAR
jgi:dipeptidyl aminopeptidase/acylaminoacyl peptidase